MNNYKFVYAKNYDCQAWNSFLENQKLSSPLACFEWKFVLEQVYGLKTKYIMAYLGKRLVGILGTYINKDINGQKTLYSTKYGLVAENSAAASELLQEAKVISDDEKCGAIEVSSYENHLSEHVAPKRKTSLHIPLEDYEDVMWTNLRDKTRNMIRRAQRDGISVRVFRGHGSKTVKQIVRPYHANLIPKGVVVHGSSFFHSLLKNLAPYTYVLVAYLDQKAIASMILHVCGQMACYPFQNVLPEFRKKAPIQLLNWEVMKLAAQKGAQVLDMGESQVDSPVYKSKVHFGGQPQDVYYYHLKCDMPKLISNEKYNLLQRVRGRLDTLVLNNAPYIIRKPYALHRVRFGRIL